MRAKVPFLATLGHVRAFLAIKEPLRTQREFFSKIRECYISPILSCNSMQNVRKIQWIVIENFPDGRTDGRTRVNSKVPIPTKVGGPINRHTYQVFDRFGKTAPKGVFLAPKRTPGGTLQSYPEVEVTKIM